VGAQRSVSATMRVTGPHRGIAAPAGERPAVRRAPRDDTLQVSGFPGIRESKVGVWCKSIVSADPAAPSTGNRRLRTALFHPIFFLQGRFLQNDKPLALDDHARCSPGFQHRGLRLRAERRAPGAGRSAGDPDGRRWRRVHRHLQMVRLIQGLWLHCGRR
jgi:hypothetical protein